MPGGQVGNVSSSCFTSQQGWTGSDPGASSLTIILFSYTSPCPHCHMEWSPSKGRVTPNQRGLAWK